MIWFPRPWTVRRWLISIEPSERLEAIWRGMDWANAGIDATAADEDLRRGWEATRDALALAAAALM